MNMILSNFTLTQNKIEEQRFYCCSPFHRHKLHQFTMDSHDHISPFILARLMMDIDPFLFLKEVSVKKIYIKRENKMFCSIALCLYYTYYILLFLFVL